MTGRTNATAKDVAWVSYIEVTSDVGATVTVSFSGTTVASMVVSGSGVVKFRVTRSGTYSVTASLGSQTVSETVNAAYSNQTYTLRVIIPLYLIKAGVAQNNKPWRTSAWAYNVSYAGVWPSVSTGSGYIDVSKAYTTNQNATAYECSAAYDISKYKNIHVKIAGSMTGFTYLTAIFLGFYAHPRPDYQLDTSRYVILSANNGQSVSLQTINTYDFDISSINGLLFPFIGMAGHSAMTARIYDIWLD